MGFTSNSKHSQASSGLEVFPFREGYKGDRFTAGSTVTTSPSSAFGVGVGFVCGGSAASQKGMKCLITSSAFQADLSFVPKYKSNT